MNGLKPFTAGYAIYVLLKIIESILKCAVQATSTGQLNTILTFYDITDPQVESELSSIPIPLLKKAISILSKTGRAQLIGVSEGEGVRIFASGR